VRNTSINYSQMECVSTMKRVCSWKQQSYESIVQRSNFFLLPHIKCSKSILITSEYFMDVEHFLLIYFSRRTAESCYHVGRMLMDWAKIDSGNRYYTEAAGWLEASLRLFPVVSDGRYFYHLIGGESNKSSKSPPTTSTNSNSSSSVIKRFTRKNKSKSRKTLVLKQIDSENRLKTKEISSIAVFYNKKGQVRSLFANQLY